MSDVSAAVEQDAVAESLLGPQDEAVQDTGAEETVSNEEQLVESEPLETQEEQADDWLPTEQEKVFPDDVLLRYAQRYQKDAEWLSDPLNRQLLTDKINSDLYFQQQQQTQEYEEEPEPEPTREQSQPQVTREQYFQNLDRMIQQRTDPEIAKAFHGDFLRAFGVPDADIARMPSDQAMRFTQTASKYMLNLVNTYFGDMLSAQLGNQMKQAYPEFGEMYERSAYAMAWDRVRNSAPQYAALPAYGTKEFSQTLHDAESKFPELLAAFEGQDGVIPTDKAAKAYGLLARIASGQTIDPKLLQQAAQSGARAQRRADVRRTGANLGSGQSKAASQRSGSRFQTNGDLFDDDTMSIYHREHGRL